MSGEVKRNRYGNLTKSVLFAILVALMLMGILRVFNYKTTGGGGGWQNFYRMGNEGADVMFFGSSHAHCTVDHGYLWDNYGMAGYTLSAGSQQLDSTRYFVKEALKRQKPRVIAVEMMGTVMGDFVNTDADVYRNSLGMKWSKDLVRYVDYLADSMQLDQGQRNEILAKIPVVHSRYKELVRSDFEDELPFMVGYRGSYGVTVLERPVEDTGGEVPELSGEVQKVLEEIIAEAQKNDVGIVFFAAPFAVTQEQQRGFEAAEEFARARGVPFINYNKLYDEIGIDFATDFRDEGHVNNYGAEKVTAHLASFLKENYEIPDRRGDQKYQIWEDNALYLRNKALCHELENAADINEYLGLLAQIEDEKTVLIALTGNYGALGDVYLDRLMQLGITQEEYAAGGVFLFKGGERLAWLPGKEYDACFAIENFSGESYSSKKGEIHVESSLTLTEDGQERQEVCLLVNGNDYFMVENGVNLIVYEQSLDQVIDAAGDDVYLGLELIHNDKQEE